MSLFKGQVDQPEENKPPIPEEEEEILEKVAMKAVEWRMAVPAIIFLESIKPLNYIGSQVMVFFEPIVQSLFNFKYYEAFRSAMERRENVENLLQKIEKYDAMQFEREKKIKKFMRAEKKKWRWYQRYLGIKRPRVEYPEEFRHPPWRKEKSE